MEISGLVTRSALLAAGYSDDELRRWCSSGALSRIAPGAYIPSDDARLGDEASRHLLAVDAALARAGPGAVVSHASAAVLHGLPVWSLPLDRVHLTRARPTGGRRSRLLHLHAAPLRPDDVVDGPGGIAVTSVARTLADLARTTPFEPAVAVVDAALHADLASWTAVESACNRAAGRRGATAAGRVVAFADGRSESVGESRSRVALRRAGLPPPVLQWEVRSGGTLLGRVDFGWPELATVGEFDGRAKYGRVPGRDPAEVLWTEKRREDALRDHGLRVVRWTWSDLDTFEAVALRLRAAFGGGRGGG